MSSSIFNFESLKALLKPTPAISRSVLAVMAMSIGCFVLAPLVLHAVFFTSNFQSRAVAALGPGTETLAIGSSRVFFGLDPRPFEGRLVNLAADYLDLSAAEELWRAHVAKVPGARTLVLEFGMATLRYDMRTLEPYACYHLGLTGLPPLAYFVESFDAAVHRTLAPFFKWRLTPLFLRIHRDLTTGTLEPFDAVPGFVPTEVEYKPDGLVAERRQAKAVRQLAAQDPAVYRRNLAAGKSLIADANAKGWRVLLLRFPKAPDARPLYLKEWDEFVTDARAELERDDRKLRFEWLDLSRDERFEAPDFRDPDHLNRRGAAKLAGILAARLR